MNRSANSREAVSRRREIAWGCRQARPSERSAGARRSAARLWALLGRQVDPSPIPSCNDRHEVGPNPAGPALRRDIVKRRRLIRTQRRSLRSPDVPSCVRGRRPSSAVPDLELDPLAARVPDPATIGRTYASLPFFLPSHHERTSGISMPQAGWGRSQFGPRSRR